MLFYVARRVGQGIILIVVVIVITFALTRVANIPVARTILGPSANAAQINAENKLLGLNGSIPQQFVAWAGNALHGNLGTSYFTSTAVTSDLASRLPVTLSVVLLASVITLLVSVLLGVASAARRGALDRILQGIATISYVFPGIILAIVLVFVFSVKLQLVPATGFVSLTTSFSGWFTSVILPALVLAIGGIAALAAQIRGSLIDELSKDYIRTLRSRGISERSILCKHALRNAASPALTTFSLQFITMFGGSLFIERIFNLPGFGTYAYNATTQGDLPAMMGVTLFSVILVVVVNLVVDLVNGWLNPKARLQ